MTPYEWWRAYRLHSINLYYPSIFNNYRRDNKERIKLFPWTVVDDYN